MKLWKSLKISIGSRSDPKSYSQDLPQWGGQGYELDVFKSQTSLSTDSGLCTERGLRRTHIEVVKPPGKRIGLKLAGNDDEHEDQSRSNDDEIEPGPSTRSDQPIESTEDVSGLIQADSDPDEDVRVSGEAVLAVSGLTGGDSDDRHI